MGQVHFFFIINCLQIKRTLSFIYIYHYLHFFHKWTCSTFKINGSNIHVKSQYFTSKFISLQVKSHSKTSRKFSIWPTVATYRLSCSTGRCDPCRGTARHPVSSRPLCTRPTKCPRSPCIPSRGSPVDHTHTHTRPDHQVHVQMRYPLRNVPREYRQPFSICYIQFYLKESCNKLFRWAPRASLGPLRNVVGLKLQFRRDELEGTGRGGGEVGKTGRSRDLGWRNVRFLECERFPARRTNRSCIWQPTDADFLRFSVLTSGAL